MSGQKIVVVLLLKNATKKNWQAHLTSRDRAENLRFQKIQTTVQIGTVAITQVTSALVRPVIKSSTEAMTFAN